MIEVRIQRGNQQQIQAGIVAAAWEGLLRAVVYYHSALLAALNVSNPRPHETPSPPGQPPRKRTGWLQRNVLYETDEKAGLARVGITKNARYGLFLELGTGRMAARPWLLATLQRVWPRMQALAGSGRGSGGRP